MQYLKEDEVQKVPARWMWALIFATVFFSVLVTFCMQPNKNIRASNVTSQEN